MENNEKVLTAVKEDLARIRSRLEHFYGPANFHKSEFDTLDDVQEFVECLFSFEISEPEYNNTAQFINALANALCDENTTINDGKIELQLKLVSLEFGEHMCNICEYMAFFDDFDDVEDELAAIIGISEFDDFDIAYESVCSMEINMIPGSLVAGPVGYDLGIRVTFNSTHCATKYSFENLRTMVNESGLFGKDADEVAKVWEHALNKNDETSKELKEMLDEK